MSVITEIHYKGVRYNEVALYTIAEIVQIDYRTDVLKVCTVGQINEFAIVRGCLTERGIWHLAYLTHSQLKMESYY